MTIEAQRMVRMTVRICRKAHPRYGQLLLVIGTKKGLCICQSLDSFSRNVLESPEDLKEQKPVVTWVDA